MAYKYGGDIDTEADLDRGIACEYLVNGLRVPYSEDVHVFCAHSILRLSDLVKRFLVLSPADADFERYMSSIFTYSNAFLSFFSDDELNRVDGDAKHVGTETAFDSFMRYVYRPFFEHLSKFVDMRKAGVDAIRLFESLSKSAFCEEGESFRDAANRNDGAYVHAVGDQINLRGLQLLRVVHEKRANIDTLTGVYSRRRIFELLRTMFGKYVIDNDSYDVSDGQSSSDDCDGDDVGVESVSSNDFFGRENDDMPLSSTSGATDLIAQGPEVESPKSLAIVFIDLDHFKLVNDRFGHPVGDQVLRIVGRVLRESVRINDLVGRFGGEEFILALEDVTFEQVLVICDRLRRDIDKAVKKECPDLAGEGLTASIGIALFSDNYLVKDANDLINAGDVAAYAVKRTGRNGMVCIKGGELYKIQNNNGVFELERISVLQEGANLAGVPRP